MNVCNKIASLFSMVVPENGCIRPEVMKGSVDIAFELAYDIVRYFTETKPPGIFHPYAKTMRRITDEISEKHQILFTGFMKRLSITRLNWRVTFTNVANELFDDGKCNWGRLVTIYAFAGYLARHCKMNGMEDLVLQVADQLGSYVTEKFQAWIRSQGGWESFEQFYAPKAEMETMLWNGLLCTFVGLGLVATMAAIS